MSTIEHHTFYYQGEHRPIELCNTEEVAAGVSCEAYEFTGETAYCLAIITMKPFARMPIQVVRGGLVTFEEVITGDEGTRLRVLRAGKYEVVQSGPHIPSTPILPSDVMQWTAGPKGAKFSEVCWPPFEEGRFETLDEWPNR